jgi:hypothetical protein
MIQGEGFDPIITNNEIVFNELPANIVYATPTVIAASVPANAATGTIKVIANGRDSNTMPFTVLPKTIQEDSPAPTEPATSSTTILPNQTANGALAQATEQDRYTFMGLEGDIATLKARAIAPATLGLMLALEDPNGVIIASTERPYFDVQLSNLQLPSTGQYALVVFAAGAQFSGQYSVSLSIHNHSATVGQVNITQGDGQTTQPGSELPEPLQIYVTGPTGKPLVGAPITFTATDINFGAGGSTGFSAANAGSTIIVTDVNGVATVKVTAPLKTGVYDITISVPGLAPKTVQLAITNKKIASLVVSQQAPDCGGLGCPVGELLPEPYSLQVLDAEGKGIPNVFVKWFLVTGKGELKQYTPATNASGRQLTDAQGRVQVFHKLGEKLYTEQAGEPTGITIPQTAVAVVSGVKQAHTLLFQPKPKANTPSKLESTKTDYIRITYNMNAPDAFRIRVLDRFNNPVENADIRPGGLKSPMSIVPGIDIQPGHGQAQAEQFTSFKTNRFGIWAGQLTVGKSTPTLDEFNSTSSAGLASTYKVTLSEASAGSHSFSVDVDLGPRMVTQLGQPITIEGLVGQPFAQPSSKQIFRYQRLDTYKPKSEDSDKDEDDGDWRDEKFSRLAEIRLHGIPAELTSRRLDGNDFATQGYKPLSLNASEGPVSVTSDDDGLIRANVKGSDVLGDAFVTAKIKTPITLQLKTDTGTPIGDPVTYPLENYQFNASIARVLAPELTSTIKAAPGSSLDWPALKLQLNSTTIFSGASPQAVNTLPQYLKIYLDGAEQSTWPTAETLTAGAFNSLTLVYSPTAKDLQTGANRISLSGQLKDTQGNTAPITKEQSVNWPPSGTALAARQWEITQAVGGLRVAYQLPHEETDITHLLETQTNRTRRVRSLGGLRLKYRFQPPTLDQFGALEPVQSINWQFNADGWICSGPGINGGAGCAFTPAGTGHAGFVNEGQHYLWWEPATGDEPNRTARWENGQLVKASYNAVTLDKTGAPTNYSESFTVETRELKAGDKGSDVQMLEAVLWQLGVSPSKSPGSVRELGSNYSTGVPSIQKMVCRFNYISYAGLGKDGKCDMKDDGIYKPIAELSRHWSHYIQAYNHWKTKPNLKFDDLDDTLGGTALTAAANAFDGTISYPDGPNFTAIPATYSATVHAAVKKLTGVDFKPGLILKGMAQIESGGLQWKNYRVTVGGADERGSKGFNQIYNAYTYGGQAQDSEEAGVKAAEEFSAYTATGASSINHYDARHNIVAKAVALAKDDTKGGVGSFYRAFSRTGNEGYAGTYSNSTDSPLRKITTGTVSNAATAATHADDEYELLAKGLGGYNQGASVFLNVTSTKPLRTLAAPKAWVELLINGVSDTKEKSVKYAMTIMHDADKMDLPYRNYIWKGGVYAAPDPRAGQEWCFVYGEREWIKPDKFMIGGKETRGSFENYKNRSLDDDSFKVSCGEK